MEVKVLSQNPLSIHSKFNITAHHLHFLPCQVHENFLAFKLFSHDNPSALSTGPPSKSSAFITLLEDYNFSSDQVESIIRHRQYDDVLSRKGAEIVKPKIDYLLEFGFSRSELIKLLCIRSNVLSSNFDRRLIPNINLLKTFVGSPELVKKAIFRYPGLLVQDLEKQLMPNVKTLIANGVPPKSITFTFVDCPGVLDSKPDRFVSVVNELKKLGFDPSSIQFILALETKIAISQSSWDRRLDIFKSFGWSDEDFNSAYRRRPLCIVTSDLKIKKMMDFYVNTLGWDPIFLSENPYLISVSLEKRIIPRCAVSNVLAERGFLGERIQLHRILVHSNKDFEARFVKRFEDRVPEIVEVYESGTGIDFSALRSWQERNKHKAVIPRKRRLSHE